MSGLNKDRLIPDKVNPLTGDYLINILMDASGNLVTTTLVGAARGLDVNILNKIGVDIDGIYNDPDNLTPDTVGNIFHTRGAAVDKTNQTLRTTGASPAADNLDPANIIAQDQNSFLHGWETDSWDRLQSVSGALKVNIDGSTNPIQVVGNVADDAVDSGNPVKVGARALDGALAALSASGDRSDLITDMYRRLYINDSPNIAGLAQAAVVGVAAAKIVAANLAGRRRMSIQNNGTREIVYGFSNAVTLASGTIIGRGSNVTLEIGPNIDVWAIAPAAAQDVRVTELA